MKRREIQEGAVYSGPSGRKRRVLSITNNSSDGLVRVHWYPEPELNQMGGSTPLPSFAKWAKHLVGTPSTESGR